VRVFYGYSFILYSILMTSALFFLCIGFESPKKSPVELDQEKNIQEEKSKKITDELFLNDVNSLGVK
jgi:hypothetical protein